MSYVPVPPVPLVIWAPLVIGVFPSLVVGIVLNRNEESPSTGNRWFTRAAAIALALALVSFISGFVQLGHGVPQFIHGAYYQDSHGTLTRVSHDTYLWAARAEARMAGGVACLFYLVAAGRYAERWLDD
jgi:hypothetical protein